jgi:hypothetical protein
MRIPTGGPKAKPAVFTAHRSARHRDPYRMTEWSQRKGLPYCTHKLCQKRHLLRRRTSPQETNNDEGRVGVSSDAAATTDREPCVTYAHRLALTLRAVRTRRAHHPSPTPRCGTQCTRLSRHAIDNRVATEPRELARLFAAPALLRIAATRVGGKSDFLSYCKCGTIFSWSAITLLWNAALPLARERCRTEPLTREWRRASHGHASSAGASSFFA